MDAASTFEGRQVDREETDVVLNQEHGGSAETKKPFDDDGLKLARQAYEKYIKYVPIAPGMSTQIYRNGLLSKKTLDGDGYNRMYASKVYHGDDRSNTSDGSIIIHKNDANPGNCAFLHPPYESDIEFSGEDDIDYGVHLTLVKLATAGNKCSFCSILYRGICSQRQFWILKWARCQWINTHTHEDLQASDSEMPWIGAFADEVMRGKEIDERELFLYIYFPKGHPYVGVHMMVAPHPTAKNERRRPLLDIELYTGPGHPSPWSAFGPAPHIHSEVISDFSLEQISSWIEKCKANHPSCNNTINFKSPTRILHISGMDNNSIPIIRLENTDPSLAYEYTALSHVWSFTTPFKTISQNLVTYQEAIPWGDLSIGLQESIVVTMCLGMSYIWIDSLCIIQDSPSDFEAQCPLMGSIYASASVVLAAHGHQLAFEKMPLTELRDLDPSRKEDNSVFARVKIEHYSMFAAPSDTGSWFGRGRCMQERFFANRILHFGGYAEEVFFECNVGTRCECSRIASALPSTSLFRRTFKAKLSGAISLATWHPEIAGVLDQLWRIFIEVCENYTARGLTYGADTFPTISGLMARLAPLFGNYYAGIWEKYLLLNLQWEALNTQLCHRHEEYVAPSWSWASRSGAVIWYMNCLSTDTVSSSSTPLPMIETHDFAAVVSIECVLAGADPHGQVSNGQLGIRGYTTEMCVVSTPPLAADGRMEIKRPGMDGEEDHGFVTFDTIEDAQETVEGETLTCLDIMRDKEGVHGLFVSALVLRPVGDGKGEGEGESVFRRVGFSTLKVEHFEGAERREITIV